MSIPCSMGDAARAIGPLARETLEKPDGLDLAIVAAGKQRARLHGFLTTGIA
ncbi:hypothetical protein [Caballeronia sp. dw_19]|uniref:hypothetical protein n=1 Tax=Caballeronia sp. dw_19 TaxID=2719791 RepID=UPI001BD3F56C|nr:hypothetical protein [Caballeronia sp. dw_19]